MVAVDCEMVITAAGFELARVSLVDGSSGRRLLDQLVVPDSPVLDYNTKYSGGGGGGGGRGGRLCKTACGLVAKRGAAMWLVGWLGWAAVARCDSLVCSHLPTAHCLTPLPAPCLDLPTRLPGLPAGITPEMLARGATSVAEAQRAVLRLVGPHTLLVRTAGTSSAQPAVCMSAAVPAAPFLPGSYWCHTCLVVHPGLLSELGSYLPPSLPAGGPQPGE